MNPKTKTWKRLRVIVFSIASFSILVLSIAFVWRIALERTIRAEVQKIADDLQSRGLPIDMESLQSVYDAKPNPPNLEGWLDLIERVSHIDVPSIYQPVQAAEVFDNLEREPLDEGNSSEIIGNDEKIKKEVMPTEDVWAGRLVRAVNGWNSLSESDRQVIDELRSLIRNEPTPKLPVRFQQFELGNKTTTEQLSTATRLIELDGMAAIDRRESHRLCVAIEDLIKASFIPAREMNLESMLSSFVVRGRGLELVLLGLQRNVFDNAELVRLTVLLRDLPISFADTKGTIDGERAAKLPLLRWTVEPNTGTLTQIPRSSNGDGKQLLLSLAHFDAVGTSSFEAFWEGYVPAMRSILRMNDSETTRKYPHASFALVGFRVVTDGSITKAIRQRLCLLAVQLRLAEERLGRLPATYEELETAAPEARGLLALHGQRFGFRSEGEYVQLWGYPCDIEFDLVRGPAKTSEEPTKDFIMETQWVWRFPKR